jgi:asparagine synthase (glutamine-hydrolysing)
MCGIAGLVGPQAHEEPLRKMLDAIHHRGPDDWGSHLAAGAAIGMRRLSIIDLAGGHQPMFSDDGRYAIVFNGEIYNYLELAEELRERGATLHTNSDTEVILRLYELDGEKCLAPLRGMFAFAIWDSFERRLFVARDRLGKKPLYYGWVSGTFAFGSELKSLRTLPGVSLELDEAAVDDYFAYRYVPGPRTIFKGFAKLPPGHHLTLANGTVEIKRYWEPQFKGDSQLSEREAERAFAATLEDAVRLRLRSDVPVGAFLSGGLDSSVLVALMAHHSTRPVQTFTVSWGGAAAVDELKPAREVAKLFGTEHTDVVLEPNLAELLPRVVWHLDEPLADPAALPTLLMSEVAAKQVKVVLSGEGADELFGGYDYLRTLNWLSRVPDRPGPLRAVAGGLSRVLPRRGAARKVARLAELLSGDLSDGLRTTLSVFREHERRRLLPHVPAAPRTAQRAQNVNDLLQELTNYWLPDELLMKVDKMTMAAGIEARAPFLDHQLFELVGTFPDHYKVDGPTSKKLLRQAARRWLAPSVVDRHKQGFVVPIEKWLSGSDPFVEELLSPSALIRHGYVEPREVVKLRQEGPRSALKLWTVLSFQLWCEQLANGTSFESVSCELVPERVAA